MNRREMWYNMSPRFSIGFGCGNYLSTPAITWFGTPKRKHHKIYFHLVVLYVVFAWHRRKSVSVVINDTNSGGADPQAAA